jgi:TolA-binding protein
LGQVFESDRPAESEKYYTELLESDSFFAPEGGIFLADFQKKQGKADDAKKTYEKIKQRFPGYTKYVDELAKDPKPMKFGM